MATPRGMRRAPSQSSSISPTRRAAISRIIVRYIVPINPHLDPDAIVRELGPSVGPQLGETMLTYQQMLEEDRKEFSKEGHREGHRAILLRQLARRFGSLPETITTRIEAATNSDIERWADRILDATSLDDVFSAP